VTLVDFSFVFSEFLLHSAYAVYVDGLAAKLNPETLHARCPILRDSKIEGCDVIGVIRKPPPVARRPFGHLAVADPGVDAPLTVTLAALVPAAAVPQR
jgi:hypothetical protein